MLDFLYLVFIAPIEICMRSVLDFFYAHTNSWGLSLIGLSIVVNTAILPVYNRVEKWQEEERDVKKRMQPKEEMIRRHFKGQERFAMLSALYRQYGYSPLLSLRNSLGLFLQIPFFIAAYQLLLHMPALNGAGFGPIHNLGAPDAMLAIGGFAINIIPIVMTAVNLCSAFIYAQNLLRRDKIQLYGMAALFLVLLYNSPAALTFYWTMNNVYSLCKNFAEKDLLKRHGFLAVQKTLAEKNANLWHRLFALAIKTASYPVKLSAVAGIVAILSILMFGYDFWADKYNVFNLNFFAMGIVLGGFFLLALALLFLCKKYLPKFCSITLLETIFTILFILCSSFVIVKFGYMQDSIIKAYARILLVCAALFVCICCTRFAGKIYSNFILQKKELGRLFLPAAALISFLVLVYVPFLVFSSDPLVFNLTLKQFVSDRLGLFLAVIICTAIFGEFARRFNWLFGSVLTVIAFIAMIFCFIVTPDTGPMNGFLVQKDVALDPWFKNDVDIAVFIFALFVFIAALYVKKIKILANILYASLTILVFMSCVYFNSAKDILAKTAALDQKHISSVSRQANASADKIADLNDSAADTVPEDVRDFFTFSKYGKNIVVVMLDMFTGGNMNQVLERHPELKTALDGFTWYEDCVTGGSYTILGYPGILGGEIVTPVKSNMDTDNSLNKKISVAHGQFLRYLQDHNFSLSMSPYMAFYDESVLNSYFSKTGKINFKSEDIWSGSFAVWQNRNFKINDAPPDFHKFFNVIGFYSVAPWRYKIRIYDFGNWNNSIPFNNISITYPAKYLAHLELPLYASRVSDINNNCFIFLVNQLSHVPWSLDENGLPTSNGSWGHSRSLANYGLLEEHIRSEYFAIKHLIRWFKWMKGNDVYNNTMIILVSDHGKGDSADIVKALKAIPPVFLHGLLMVKEYNAHGELKIDRTSQMANWDVQTIIRNALAADESQKQFPWQNKARPRHSVDASHVGGRHNKNTYNIDRQYLIQGPLYNKESWIRIQ